MRGALAMSVAPLIASPQYQLFVGVDIAAKTFTVAWQGAQQMKPQTLDQSSEGFSRLHQALQKTGIAPEHILVVMEATGAYWAALATFLVRQGFVVSVINAMQAHHFAKALLQTAKTDAIDAQILTQLAMALQPAPWAPPPLLYEELQQRLAQRDALLVMRNQVTNQRHALIQGPVVVQSVRERMDRLEQTLTEQIAAIEAELLALLQQDIARECGWAQTIERLQSIPGVGLITSLWIVVSTLNFSCCSSPEQVVAYAGLAPIPRQSGSSVNKYPGIGHCGHGRLRTAVYLATLTAARFNPPLKVFYERLRAKGKPSKVARCAVARKLLHLAWAIGTKQTLFDAQYQILIK
jgi:transposase